MTGKIIPWVRSYSFLHLTSYKDLLHARSPSRVWPTGTEGDVDVSSLCKAHAHPVWVLFLFWVRFSILSLGEGSSYISCLPGSRCPSLSHWPKCLFPVPVVVPGPIFHGGDWATESPASYWGALNTSTLMTQIRARTLFGCFLFSEQSPLKWGP